MDDHDPTAAGLAAANRFFDGLLAGDLAALEAACAPSSILGTVEDGRITRFTEYVDGGQAGALSVLLKGR